MTPAPDAAFAPDAERRRNPLPCLLPRASVEPWLPSTLRDIDRAPTQQFSS